LLTAGDNTTSGGSSTPWVGNTNFPTNTVVKAYQAGGAVRIGAKGALGSITSRAINLAGNGGAFNISFKVKGWSTKEGDIKVTAGSQSQNVTYEATMSESFESKTLKFTGGTSATTIMIETTAGRAYIDDVTVTSEAPSSPPVITSPSTAGGVAGQALFTYQITASNAPTSYGATNLPAWASINTTNGLISGTNPIAGTNVVTISASNSVGVGSNNLTITILPSGGGGTTSTIFSENMGAPTATTTTIASYASGTSPTTFQNKGVLTYGQGVQANPADVRNTSVSSGYTGASGGGNIWFTTTSGAYGFSIEGINASAYTQLQLTYGYYKTSSSAHAAFSVDYWNGSSWVTVANTASTLFTESASASLGWYAAKSLSLPAGAQVNGLKLRFVKTSGILGIRIDDVKLTGVTSTSPTLSTTGSLSAVNTVYGIASTNPTSFTLSGANLAEGITVAPPAGFEVSAGNTNGFAGQGNSIIVGSAGTVASTTIFVRLAADTDVGNYSGNIVCSSVGASNASVATVASTVSAKPLTVTANLLRKTYGLEDPELTYNSSEAAPFSGGLTRAAGESVGAYAITQGDLSAGPNYTISFTGNNFEIMRKSLNITASDMTKTFGQTLVLGTEQTNFTSSGLVNGETVGSVTLTASGGIQADDAVGFYTLTPSQATGGTFSLNNYTTIYNSGTLTVRAGESTFSGWAGEGVLMTPELLMKYAIGGAASPSATGELPVVGMDGSNLTLTAIVRKDSTLKVEGQAVTNLEAYGTQSWTPITGTLVGVSQDGVPTDCERKIFKSTLTGSKSFLRLSVQKQ
jgi:hypothetical protein